jgi:hypothetical protein
VGQRKKNRRPAQVGEQVSGVEEKTTELHGAHDQRVTGATGVVLASRPR